jgi:hypothetical protein
MRFHEETEGDYRIYAGAVEAPQGAGYIAAVVVRREQCQPPQVAWRDDSVACGYRWASPEQAIAYALTRARELIRHRPAMLRC